MDSVLAERDHGRLRWLSCWEGTTASCTGLAPPRIMEVIVLSPGRARQQEKWVLGGRMRILILGTTLTMLLDLLDDRGLGTT